MMETTMSTALDSFEATQRYVMCVCECMCVCVCVHVCIGKGTYIHVCVCVCVCVCVWCVGECMWMSVCG